MTSQPPVTEALVAELLERACLAYDTDDWPSKWRRAERIRVRHPWIATASIHTAVVCGEIEHVRKLLQDAPALATCNGGSQGWEPLLFLCFGRLPNERAKEHSLAIAELLLDNGADPNTHWVTRDESKIRFTALAGAMGGGELGQPEHTRAEELARLLLARGADPNEGQGLYNTHLVGDDTRWLDILFSHGLNRNHLINWNTQSTQPEPPILDYLIAQAAANGHVKRLHCLLDHGADPNARSTYDGKTCYQAALLTGKREVSDLLLRHGAHPDPLEGRDAFVAACMHGDRDEASRILGGHPDYLENTDPLIKSAEDGNEGAVRLLLHLGMDPSREGQHDKRPLHVASKHRAVTELLLSHGADPRERCYGGTPANWACLAGDIPMAQFLASKSRTLLDAVMTGHVDLARELVLQDPGCLQERSHRADTPLHVLPEDPATARPLLELLLAHGADPAATNDAGQTPAQKLEDAGLDEIADLFLAIPSSR